MTLDDFRALVAAHGASSRRWPADRRATAEALLASDEAAQAAWQEARRLDLLLDAVPAPAPVAADLTDRVVRRALAAGRPRLVWPFRNVAVQAAALAACLVLGIALGLAAPEPATDEVGDEVAVLVLGPGLSGNGDLP